MRSDKTDKNFYSHRTLHNIEAFLAGTTDHHQTLHFDNWFGILEPNSLKTGQSEHPEIRANYL